MLFTADYHYEIDIIEKSTEGNKEYKYKKEILSAISLFASVKKVEEIINAKLPKDFLQMVLIMYRKGTL